MTLADITLTVVALQVGSLILAPFVDRKGWPDHVGQLLVSVTWPLLLLARLALIPWDRLGMWISWRGAMAENPRPGMRQLESWDETGWGPFHRGFWLRPVSYANPDGPKRLGRWAGAGKTGGRGITIGWTVTR